MPQPSVHERLLVSPSPHEAEIPHAIWYQPRFTGKETDRALALAPIERTEIMALVEILVSRLWGWKTFLNPSVLASGGRIS